MTKAVVGCPTLFSIKNAVTADAVIAASGEVLIIVILEMNDSYESTSLYFI